MNDQVATAQQNLIAAQAAVEQARQQERAALVEKVEEQGRNVKAAFLKIQAEFYESEHTALVFQHQLNGINDQIDEHNAVRPNAENFPSLAEMELWTNTLSELAATRSEIITHMQPARAIVERLRLGCVQAHGALEAAQRNVKNLRNSEGERSYVKGV